MIREYRRKIETIFENASAIEKRGPNRNRGKNQGWANVLFKRTQRSFAFFSKERNVIAFFCVLYKKNAAFFTFFSILYKRTKRSLCSFTFFIKDTLFIQNYKSCKKKNAKERSVLFIRLKRNLSFFFQYIFIL